MCCIPFPPNFSWRNTTPRASNMITPGNITYGILFYPINCISICGGLFKEEGLILKTGHGRMSWSPTYKTSLEYTFDASEKRDIV
jgi:hypothetical protein